MLKLKDCNVIEIYDDTEDFYEFGGTWSEDIHRKMHNISFETDTGKVIHLESFSEGHYGNTNGFEDVGEMYVTMMKKVYHGEMEEMTLTALIHWIIEEYSNGRAMVSVGNKKGYYLTGKSQGMSDSYRRTQAFDWYANQLNRSDEKRRLLKIHNAEFMEKLKSTYDAEKDVYVVDMDSEELPVTMTIDEFICGN